MRFSPKIIIKNVLCNRPIEMNEISRQLYALAKTFCLNRCRFPFVFSDIFPNRYVLCRFWSSIFQYPISWQRISFILRLGLGFFQIVLIIMSVIIFHLDVYLSRCECSRCYSVKIWLSHLSPYGATRIDSWYLPIRLIKYQQLNTKLIV